MVYLITHTDLDGVAPEILAKLIWKPHQLFVLPAEAYAVDEAVLNLLDQVQSEDTIYIVDCAPSEVMMAQLNQLDCKKFLFDHHEPKFNIDLYPWATVDANGKESGTSMFCKYLEFPDNEISKFAELVRRWDTWEWTKREGDIEPSQLNQLFMLMGREDFVNHCVECLSENNSVLNDLAMKLIYFKEREIERYVENKLTFTKVVNVNGNPCAVVMAESYKSQLATAMMNHFEVNMAAVIGTEGVSLRSKGDLDISEIAIKFGGGGRKNTGGYGIPKEVKDAFFRGALGINNNIERMNLV